MYVLPFQKNLFEQFLHSKKLIWTYIHLITNELYKLFQKMYHLDAQSLDYVLFFLAVVSIIFFFVFWTISILSFIGA